ncbi:DUF1127 domain-containing protein [Starkeya sp. ORNL1]|uniref:DUF1127 domain-containing protein n=1 Tax=Starkeya sp. ORNL1 TaxID=2709380 RepID=UPI001463094D|nr:DUF1127 domain-containing protein [Starkeya sp. ORNL1]QJP17133.1 DUF1127 domain-containing protein [Starkeya sp. ORNL1]
MFTTSEATFGAEGGSTGLRSAASLLKAFAVWLYRRPLAANRHCVIRRAKRELLDLPDVLLKDMGVSRSEVETLVHYGRIDGSVGVPGRAGSARWRVLP